MSVDLTFLSDSYTKQVLHQLKRVQMQKTDKASGRNDFGSILSAKGEAKAQRRKMYFIQSEEAAARRTQELKNYNKKLISNSFRSDLFGEQTILTDRGIDWLSAYYSYI